MREHAFGDDGVHARVSMLSQMSHCLRYFTQKAGDADENCEIELVVGTRCNLTVKTLYPHPGFVVIIPNRFLRLLFGKLFRASDGDERHSWNAVNRNTAQREE